MAGNGELGALLPRLSTDVPGPRSREMGARLRAVESRNVTYIDGSWPVFWEEAAGANVVDVDGNVFIDLTSAFGVSLLGHRAPTIVEAVREQSGRLVHGMGDIHPPAKKLELLERLAAASPWPDARAVLSTTGSEAVETALKTAQLASGRPGVLAFEGAYHGLTLGALATTEREHFRGPFRTRLYEGVTFAPFPVDEAEAERALRVVEHALGAGSESSDRIGTMIIEPVQARGGARVPAPGFMAALSDLAREHGVVVVADEVFTGMGRCGALFASELVGLRPDIVCVGKALGGGIPISACIAPAEVMDAWPPSGGEAIHTSSFLGHPLACAAALAALDALEGGLAQEAAALGASLRDRLDPWVGQVPGVAEVAGLGLLLGVRLAHPDSGAVAVGAGGRVAEAALRAGLLVLPAGAEGDVVELAPPAVLTDAQMEHAVTVLEAVIREAF